MIPRPEMKHRFLHQANLVIASLQPSLRPEIYGVFPKDGFVAMGRPRTDAYHCASRNLFACDLGASRRHDALQVDGGSRVHAKGFLDAGVHVGKFLSGGEVDVAFEGEGVPYGELGVEFVLKFGVAGGVFQEVVEECCQCYGTINGEYIS